MFSTPFLLILFVYFHYESTIHTAFWVFSFVIVSGALNMNYSNKYDKTKVNYIRLI